MWLGYSILQRGGTRFFMWQKEHTSKERETTCEGSFQKALKHVVVHVCYPSTWEPGLHRETQSQKKVPKPIYEGGILRPNLLLKAPFSKTLPLAIEFQCEF
jgi:hypothetical protein